MSGGIYLLLGTNLGDKNLNLSAAVSSISMFCRILRKSRVYRTKAWGNTNQPDFYNQVIEIDSSINPEGLLEKLQAVEALMGRERKEKWGARVIDIDILFYRNEIVNLPDLQIPHGEIKNRRFTLVPLCELAPHLEHPIIRKPLIDILAECPDHLSVEPVTL